jgi:hypothetical protein
MNTTFAPTAHHPNGPSNFPMWAECIAFESIPEKDPEDMDADEAEEADASAAGRGTAKHKAIAMLYSGDLPTRQRALDGLNDKEITEVQWVVEKADAILAEHGYTHEDMRVEQRLTLVDGNFQPIYFGTGDGEAGPLDFDWKMGLARNYFPQHAGYALPKLEQRGEARRLAFTVYGRLRRVERHVITLDTARSVVYGLLARRMAKIRKPTPCQYCGWCNNLATCPALVSEPVALVERREDWSLKLPSPHVSQLRDPAWLGAARFIWKNYLEKWGGAIEFACDSISAQGIKLAGYEAKPWKGRTTIADTEKAFRALCGQIPEDVVFGAMSVSIGALAKAYAGSAGISEAKAKGRIEAILSEAGLLTVAPSTLRLVAEKHAEDNIRAALSDVFKPVAQLPEKITDLETNPLIESAVSSGSHAPEGARG